MASMASILLALLVTFNAIGAVNPVNPGNPTGSLSTPEKSRLVDFQKILPAEPELASRKLHLSFVLSFQFEKLRIECDYENKRHQLTKVDYSNIVDNKVIEFHVVPTYDQNGNMKSFVHQYRYNYKNQLLEVVTGTGLNVSYKYDALGRRTEKMVSVPGEKEITRYVYAGWRVVEERDENNELLKRYTYGNGIDEQVAQEYKTENGFVTVIPMHDSIGNVIGVTDDTGKLLETYNYSTYGTPVFEYDNTPPVINNVYIIDGKVITGFSEPVNIGTVSTGMKVKHEGIVIPGTIEPGAEGKEIKFIPSSPLPAGQLTVEIAETIEDESGNQMESSFSNNVIYSETTTIVHDTEAPEVDRIEKKSSDFIVKFSERIDPYTTTDSIEVQKTDGTISGSITTVDERTVKFTPEEMLEAYQEYTLSVNSTIKDLSGKSINQFFHKFMVLPDDFLVYEKPDPNKHVNSRIGNNYLFHGREYEPEVGLYNYRNRYYMPRIGRFLQTDPMGFQDSMNMYQAFGMNPVNNRDPFGKDVLGRCSSSYQPFLKPSENEEIIKKHFRSYALVGEGIANAGIKTFLIPAKFITLPARLMFGFDFDLSINVTEEGPFFNGYLGKQSRVDIVKEQTLVFPLADWVTQTSYDVYFGLFYKGGNSSIGESSRENLARSSGALGFNLFFWGNVSKSIINQRQAAEIIRNRVLRNIEESRRARASSNFSEYARWDEIYQSVENLDFSTQPDKAVFYSGPGNRRLALEYAELHGATPIDFTVGGQHLESLNLLSQMSFARSDLIWMRASEKFAKGASGKITLFVRGSLPNRIFRKIEEPALRLNFNVTRWQYRGY